MNFLRDKVIVITGTSSGLGEQLAYLFAKNKAKLCLMGRDKIRLNKVSENIIKKGGDRPLIVPIDIKKISQIKKGVRKIIDAFGEIDILVNNAGVYGEGAIEEIPVKLIKDIFQTNVLGLIYLTQILLPRIKRGGYIINILSKSVFSPKSHIAVYAASKHAVSGLNQNLRQELIEKGIRLTEVYPGKMKTAMLSHSKEFSTFLSPKEVAKIIVKIVNIPQNICVESVTIGRFYSKDQKDQNERKN